MFKNVTLTNNEIDKCIGYLGTARSPMDDASINHRAVRNAQYEFCLGWFGYLNGIYTYDEMQETRRALKDVIQKRFAKMGKYEVMLALKSGYIDWFYDDID